MYDRERKAGYDVGDDAGFSGDVEVAKWLSKQDYGLVRKMRAIVKATHLRHYPMEFLSDAEADKFICQTFTEQQLENMKKAVIDKDGMVIDGIDVKV